MPAPVDFGFSDRHRAPAAPPKWKGSAIDETWIERSLALTVEGRFVTGIVRAIWCEIEVCITSPIMHLSRRCDARCFAFAFGSIMHPEWHYASGGELTATGRKEAESYLTDLYLDWLAVSRHETEVDERCHRTRSEIEAHEQSFRAKRDLLRAEQESINERFHCGAMTRQQLDGRMKALEKALDATFRAESDLTLPLEDAFADWMKERCGRWMQLCNAEYVLREAALVVPALR